MDMSRVRAGGDGTTATASDAPAVSGRGGRPADGCRARGLAGGATRRERAHLAAHAEHRFDPDGGPVRLAGAVACTDQRRGTRRWRRRLARPFIAVGLAMD